MIEVMGNIAVRSFNTYSVNDAGDVVCRELFPHRVKSHVSAWASELGWDRSRAERLAEHLNAVINDVNHVPVVNI